MDYSRAIWFKVKDKPMGKKVPDAMVLSGTGSRQEVICSIHHPLGMTKDEFEGNTRLILSAPLMFETLLNIKEQLDASARIILPHDLEEELNSIVDSINNHK